MTTPRFVQIHTLTSYAATLLNRDDSGLAKRLPYGGAVRTRISSQCLKRHWRDADDEHALHRIEGSHASLRSRSLVSKLVIAPLRGEHPDEVLDVIEEHWQVAVYGEQGADRKSRPTLLFGAPEIAWLKGEAARVAAGADGSAEVAEQAAQEWGKGFARNIKALRANAAMPGGLVAALFGRMVTSDPAANITAPVHVAHAFTVHAEEAETDWFTAVDDLAGAGEPRTDTIQETELSSGLFYGYVVVDVAGLLGNLAGDAALAGQVLHNLCYLVAEVSPGAKRGSTAPYGRASFLLAEAGSRQPRSLGEAFRAPIGRHDLDAAVSALSAHLERLDKAYATGEERRVMSLADGGAPAAEPATLAEVAQWAQGLPAALSQ